MTSRSTKSLSGIRVLEVGQLVAAPYAAKLLGDLGADVIKIEPPGGDRARHMGPFPEHAHGDREQSGLFLGLNTNKRSVELDLDSESGRARLQSLISDADIVIHDLTAAAAAKVGLDGDELLAAHPGLVVAAITPFGQTGPHAEWHAEEITVVHGGGWGFLIPGDDPDPTAPPLTVPGWPAHCQAATAAAFAALGAHHKAATTGIGEFIDMSVMAHVSAMLEASFIAWSYMERIPMRNDGRMLTPWHILECADGLIFLVTVEQDQWERLVEFMGAPEWATSGLFDTIPDRSANQDVLNMYLGEWTRDHTVEELWHQGQERRICFAPVFTMGDLAGQEHLRERGFFHTAEHPVAGELSYLGSPTPMHPDPWELRSTAPLLDADASATFADRSESRPAPDLGAVERKPLEGVRVIDFSWVWAGPFCTMHLAYLGADVIKVESSERPSLGRRLAVHPVGLEPTLNTCGYFNQWDQGKRSIELDLTDPESLEAVKRLIADADVVVNNYATGVMDRLGLGDDVLFELNPELIVASITGYGHDGPLKNYMGYGPTTCPLSGLTSITGHPDGPPMEAGISFGDPAAGLSTAFAIMAGLHGRDRGDGGMRVDASLWESTAVNGVHAWMDHALGNPSAGPNGSRHFAAAPHGVFPSAGDDGWISIACMSDDQWRSMADVMGLDDATVERFATLDDRKAHELELDQLVSEWTTTQDRWAATTTLQAAGVAAYPSLDCAELERNEQLVSRGFWERFDHPEVGQRTHSGVPWRTRNWPNGVAHRAPLIGEHTTDIVHPQQH